MSNIIRAVDAHYNLKNFGDAEKYKLAFYPETKALVQGDRAIREYYKCLKFSVSSFYEKYIRNYHFDPSLAPSFNYKPNESIDKIIHGLRVSKVGQFILNQIYRFDKSPIKLIPSNTSNHTVERIKIQTEMTKQLFVAINENDLITYYPYANSIQTLIHELVHRLVDKDPDLNKIITNLTSNWEVS